MRLRIEMVKGCLTQKYTGPAKHSVYAIARVHTKYLVCRVTTVQPTLLRRLSYVIRCMYGQRCSLIKAKAPAVQCSQGQIHLPLSPSLLGLLTALGTVLGCTHSSADCQGVSSRYPSQLQPLPATIPTVPQTPRCAPRPGHSRWHSWIRILAGRDQQVECVLAAAAVARNYRRFARWSSARPLTSTQTPARLQTLTNPFERDDVHRAGCVVKTLRKKSVPTTPATPAGVRTSNFPSGLAIFCACVRSFP